MTTRTIRRLDTPSEFQSERVNDETVFVIIDVISFSSTVVTLMEYGVDEVVPAYTDDELEELRLMDEIVIGGEPRSDVEVDFTNSPQNVHSVFGLYDTVPERVALTSSNGARRAIESYEETENVDAEIVIGSAMNAGAVGEWINENYPSYDVLLFCAGSGGEVAVEDVMGATVIGQELRGETVPSQMGSLINQLPIERVGSEDIYPWLSDEDLHHISNVSSSSIVPHVDVESGSIVREEV